jgi:hypothetical protein
MTQLTTQSSVLSTQHLTPIALPVPRVNITIRAGVMSDLPFLDSLQKMHTKQVGWMPTKQFEGKIKLGHVLIAEEMRSAECSVLRTEAESTQHSVLSTGHYSTPVGYCIGNDQYFKRDDVGIIYQMNVVPNRQRGLIGATLVKGMFDRAAYGCKLFCCWCAQDIEANYFWESLGFVPLAFRAGSAKKSRVHIFWQRRIRAGDETTPYWFPAQTSSGSIREDRLVLPIPPGTHWSDAKPIVLPGLSAFEGPGMEKRLEISDQRSEARKRKSAKSGLTSDLRPLTSIKAGGLKFVVQTETAIAVKPKRACPERSRREPKPKVKNDPKYVAAARELRDRWLEQVNADPSSLLSDGKYDVNRALESPERMAVISPLAPALSAPAIAA